jgi:RNA 2',3'-cyclic 3'-phosphodiesterase
MPTTSIPAARRLFIGLMPGRQVQAAIQRHCRDWEWPEAAKPTRFGRYHLTLYFLGDTGIAPEQRLRRALRQVVVEPLELELQLPEVWRNHVAVLQPAAHQGLVALRERMALALSEAGCQRTGELEFRPHVTLARNAADAHPPEAVRPIRWRVDEFALVHSVPFPQAKPARYDIVESYRVPAERALQPPAPSGNEGEQFGLL